MSDDASGGGEFDLIRRYFAPLSAGNPSGLKLEDDAAVFAPPPGREIVLTTDTMVEGIHYPHGEAADLVARKLLRVNLSDLAAMGARPELYLLNTAWRRDSEESWIALFAEGLAADQRSFGITLAGGDTVTTPGPVTLTLTAIGSVRAGCALRRGAASPGDDVYVSGTIGDGVLGLDVALGKPLPGPSDEQLQALRRRYAIPEPRVALGQALAATDDGAIACAAADVSDGLVADLGHICEASGVGAVLQADLVPLSEAGRLALGCNASLLVRAMTGGDDYELVFTAPVSASERLAALGRRLNVPLTRIGHIVAGEGVTVLDASGERLHLTATGFRHR